MSVLKTAWRYVFASVRGTSHQTGDVPCQDASIIREVQAANGESVLVLLAADGAGSATHSEIGSKLICHTLLELICRWLQNGETLSSLNRDVICEWFETRVRSVFHTQAQSSDITCRDLATTVVCALVGRQEVACFQVGDGAIVVSNSELGLETVFWPQSGEYANTTHFVTDDDVVDRLMFMIIDAVVDEVALFTDGLQMLALQYATRSVHRPFFAPMFARLAIEPPGESTLISALEDFLNSTAVNSRTDDDKTLLLATRRAIILLEEADSNAEPESDP